MDGKTCNHIRHTTIVYEVVRKESNVLRKIEVMCTKFSLAMKIVRNFGNNFQNIQNNGCKRIGIIKNSKQMHEV